MPGLFLVNAQDVARVLGPDPHGVTVQGVFERLDQLYLKKRGGGFNHDSSIRATQDIFRGSISVGQGVQYCRAHGNPKGRVQNAEIVRLVGEHAAANVSRCHRIGYIAIRIARYNGQNIHIGLKAPFIRVRGPGEAYLVLPGFRKDSRPVGWQIDFLCSVATNQLARDDFKGAEVEYLYAGPSERSTTRCFRAMYGSDMNLFTQDQVDQYLQTYVEAVVRHLEKGHGDQPAKFAGYRIVDPAQGSLF